MPNKKPATEDPPKKELTYIEKVWHTVAIVALLVVAILIARVAFNVLLMVLAGSLIAVYFHGLGDIIERRTKWNRTLCMCISVIGSFLILGHLTVVYGHHYTRASSYFERKLTPNHQQP
jgi:predicted PurR-regulated permease PerM